MGLNEYDKKFQISNISTNKLIVNLIFKIRDHDVLQIL